jgi:uncharacterized damage-inducible protein DinB
MIATMILPEFDAEMASTRKVLAMLPDAHFDWQARPGMHSIGWVVSHLVEIPSWVPGTMEQTLWDLNPPDGEMYVTPTMTHRAQALEAFDRNVAEARQAIERASDADFQELFTLANAGHALFSMPRIGVVRVWVINHTIHHRAILVTYLRLLGLAVPGMYGPGDDGAE